MASKCGGQENMIRVVIAIVDEFSEILRDVLEKKISSTQLLQTVKRSNIQLRPEQLNLVNLANVSGYADFDITLSYTLIRNLCTSIKPTQGWSHSKGPGQNDLSLGDDIERIRLIRNEVYGHVSSSFMTDSDFQKHWHEISNICKRMEQRLGKNYTAELAKIESCVIDKKLEEKYMNHIETEKQMIEEIQGMQITMSKVESQIQSFKEMLQEILSVEKDHQLYTRISPKVSPIMEGKVNQLLEIACDSLNAVVDTINENTSNEEMFEALEEVLQVGLSLEEYQGDHSDKVISLLSQLKAKVKWYSTVDERRGRQVLLKITQVAVTLMNLYKVKFQGIKGSMVLKLQFLNSEGCQKYRDDVENGNVYKLFSTALLDPTFVSLLGLENTGLDFSFETVDDDAAENIESNDDDGSLPASLPAQVQPAKSFQHQIQERRYSVNTLSVGLLGIQLSLLCFMVFGSSTNRLVFGNTIVPDNTEHLKKEIIEIRQALRDVIRTTEQLAKYHLVENVVKEFKQGKKDIAKRSERLENEIRSLKSDIAMIIGIIDAINDKK